MEKVTPTRQHTRRRPAEEIARILERMQAGGYDRHQIFVDWLELSHAALAMMPRHVASLAETGRLAVDTPEYHEPFEKAARHYGDYWGKAYEMFARALGVMIDGAWQDDRPTYEDIVGEVFEIWELHNANVGQFFTPASISSVIAGSSGVDALVYDRLREAFASTSEVVLAEMMGHRLSDEAIGSLLVSRGRPEGFEPVTISDPACGSCRMLLAVAETLPRWMIDHGLVEFYGQDIDRKCALMGRINSMLYLVPRIRMGKDEPAGMEMESITLGQLALEF